MIEEQRWVGVFEEKRIVMEREGRGGRGRRGVHVTGEED